jgi:Lrp/AsnC family transcriptional regulator, regulator for asnA, asnC and gidA
MDRQEAVQSASIDLDAVDTAILRLLWENGRRSNADIARAVGVSQPTVRKRLDRITESGAAHVTVRIDSAALGLPLTVHVCLKVSGRNVHEVGEQLAGLESVGYVAYLIGSYDLLVEANLRDNDHLFRLSEEIAAIEGVTSTDTSIVLMAERLYSQIPLEGTSGDVLPAAPLRRRVPNDKFGIGRRGSVPFDGIVLDAVDKAILRLLRENGQRSNADIAHAVGVSQPTVRKRLDRIVASGVAHVTVHVNSAAIGWPLVALINLKVSGRDVRKVGERVTAMDNVDYVGYLIGPYDLEVEAHFRDNDHLFRFLSEDISMLEGVASTDTWIVSKTEEDLCWWRSSPTTPAAEEAVDRDEASRRQSVGRCGFSRCKTSVHP